MELTPRWIRICAIALCFHSLVKERGTLKAEPMSAAVPANIDQQEDKAVSQNRFDAASQFEQVWATVRDEFWDPHLNRVDWNSMRKFYLTQAEKCRTEEELALVINPMLAELKTSHTHYYTSFDPAYYSIVAACEPKSLISRIGIGMDTVTI